MLSLTRHLDESVTLILPDGTRATVTVLRIGRRKVQLGFYAPQSVVVVRDELLTRKQLGQDAAGSDASLTQER